MLDTELLEKVLALHGMRRRRNEHESTVELAARVLHIALTFINDGVDQTRFIAALETSRTAPEWRVAGMFE
jgi:hypothetical protein